MAYPQATDEPEERAVGMVSGASKYSQTARHGHIWLGKRADSGTWHLKYKLPTTGQYRERSTGTTAKKEALREADVISGHLLNQKLGIADGTIPLDKLVENYFKAKKGRIKTKSYKRVETTWAGFKAWLALTYPEVRLVRQLTSDIIREYQRYREQSGLKQRTVNNDIPMLPEVQEVIRRRLEACCDDESLVFTNTVGNNISESWTRAKLHDMFSAVGINGDRRLHWHAFRNYFIIRCLRNGVAVPAIMKWTGHDSASMVLHYASVIREDDVYAEFRKVS